MIIIYISFFLILKKCKIEKSFYDEWNSANEFSERIRLLKFYLNMNKTLKESKEKKQVSLQ